MWQLVAHSLQLSNKIYKLELLHKLLVLVLLSYITLNTYLRMLSPALTSPPFSSFIIDTPTSHISKRSPSHKKTYENFVTHHLPPKNKNNWTNQLLNKSAIEHEFHQLIIASISWIGAPSADFEPHQLTLSSITWHWAPSADLNSITWQ